MCIIHDIFSHGVSIIRDIANVIMYHKLDFAKRLIACMIFWPCFIVCCILFNFGAMIIHPIKAFQIITGNIKKYILPKIMECHILCTFNLHSMINLATTVLIDIELSVEYLQNLEIFSYKYVFEIIHMMQGGF